jgi:molybdopterin synthase catalytic subunit
VGALRELANGHVKGERGGADLFEGGVRNLVGEKSFRELARKVREGEFGESLQAITREVWELYGEVEPAIGSESAKHSV